MVSKFGKESPSRKLFVVVNAIFLSFLGLIAVAPFLHVIMASFSDPYLLIANKGLIWHPLGFTLVGYQKVFESIEIWRGYLNTILYTAASVALGTMLTILGAYVLSRRGLYWGNKAMFFITFTMIFNGGLIPTYILIANLGWIDSPLAVIVPNCMSAFNLIILRTYFQTIPESLEESANLDGAGRLQILFRIMVPLAKSSIAVVALFYVVAQWNSYFQAMIYLRSPELYTLQLVLREILLKNTATSASASGPSSFVLAVAELIKYCVIIVSIIPMLVAYPFIQRYFVAGIMVGAVKG
jgi:putative aldouronate transport system permease protein